MTVDSKIVYTFVGSEHIEFQDTSLRENLIDINGTQYLNFTSARPNGDRLTFQPGDVVGWYTHRTIQSIDRPLTVVYRSSSSTDDPLLQPVNMYLTVIIDTDRADTQPPCELSLKNNQHVSVVSSVIPYVTVDYITSK